MGSYLKLPKLLINFAISQAISLGRIPPLTFHLRNYLPNATDCVCFRCTKQQPQQCVKRRNIEKYSNRKS